VAYAKKRSRRFVSGAMAEFGKERYNVGCAEGRGSDYHGVCAGTKCFKGEAAYTRAEALQHFRDAESMTHKPFIYLSAGVSNPVFIETLELAGESGTKFNGVLCGRATWKDGIPIFAKQGEAAFREWLETTGTENIKNVNLALEAASPWFLKYGAKKPGGNWISQKQRRVTERAAERFAACSACGADLAAQEMDFDAGLST